MCSLCLTDEFLEVFGAIHPSDGRVRILLVLAALDESGIHKQSEVCVVAGYFAKKGPWRKFDAPWRAVLNHFGVPLEKFHAKDLVSRTGFFHKWTEQKQSSLLKSLGTVVAESRIRPVCHGIYVGDFFKLSERERKFVTGATWTGKKFLTSGSPNKPYWVLFTENLKRVQDHTTYGQRVHLLCGIDRAASEYAKDVFANYQSRPSSKRKLGSIAFPYASETPHLQAADLLAHLSYHYMLERKESRDWSIPPEEPLYSLVRNRKADKDTLFFDEKVLREMISVIPNMS